MNALDELTKFQVPDPVFITVGVFDGVHKGHGRLIKKLVEAGSLAGCTSAVLTFRNNPISVVTPDIKISYLCSLEDRVEYLKQAGVDYVLPINFDYELSLMRPYEFLTLLRRSLNFKGMVMGPNFALGHKREGTVEVLKTLANELKFQVEVVEPVAIGGITVSSTSVREALFVGKVDMANKMLGRDYKISGSVVKGKGWGRALGFPTANLAVSTHQIIPKDGVYVTLAGINGEWVPAATSVGSRPTFNGNTREVEVHVINFYGDLYGEIIEVKFLERIRDQIKFESSNALSNQIEVDVDIVKSKLNELELKRKCN